MSMEHFSAAIEACEVAFPNLEICPIVIFVPHDIDYVCIKCP
jgi:hypothetical protein